jgi:hypothetical protein
MQLPKLSNEISKKTITNYGPTNYIFMFSQQTNDRNLCEHPQAFVSHLKMRLIISITTKTNPVSTLDNFAGAAPHLGMTIE